MIQIYKRENTNYENNGDFILHPIRCELKSELNGTWELTMQYPFEKSEEFEALINEAVLAVPTPYSEKQLFRIYNVEKDMSDKMVYARPVFLDSASEVMLTDVRPTDKTGQGALNLMTAGTKYKAVSDILDIRTAYYIRKNLIEAIASDDENSFLNRWGGEILYDNYTISINRSAGSDKGVSVEFGKNLTQIRENVNFDNVVTRIVPVAYNGYTLAGDNPWVDSLNINKYAVIRTKVIEYSDIKLSEDATEDDEVTYDTLEELRAALREKCEEEFDNGIDMPYANYSVEMAELSNTEEYSDYKILETVNLGDTVYCRHPDLNIDIKTKVVGINYDCINKRYNQIELGSAVQNYLTNLSGQIQSMLNAYDKKGNIKGESIAGMINLMQTKLKASYDIAQRQIERAILFEDTDTDSPTYGAMALGTTGFQIASHKNMLGEWDWRTFGTGEGFLADYIIAGVLYSQNYIENNQGVKIDLNNGLINAYNLAWVAANSSMTPSGTLTTRDIVINGGSMNVNGKFKVTSDGKLSWDATNSSMTENGAITCKNFKMTGGSIDINGTDFRLEISDSVISILNKNTNEVISIIPGSIGSSYKDENNHVIRTLISNGIYCEDTTTGAYTRITPGHVTVSDGTNINIFSP